MSDIKNAYDQVVDFLSNESEKTLLLRGIASSPSKSTQCPGGNERINQSNSYIKKWYGGLFPMGRTL